MDTINAAGTGASGMVRAAVDTELPTIVKKGRAAATVTGTAWDHSSVLRSIVAALSDSTAVEVNIIGKKI